MPGGEGVGKVWGGGGRNRTGDGEVGGLLNFTFGFSEIFLYSFFFFICKVSPWREVVHPTPLFWKKEIGRYTRV